MRSGTLRDAVEEAASGRKDAVPTINLALQGGGAHGAFTWGVIDRLLEEVEAGRLKIQAVSGTSAGAMNAAVMMYGLETDGPRGARKLLDNFWRGVSTRNLLTPLHEITTKMNGSPNLGDNPAFAWIEAWKSVLSPQQFNPLNLNPLRSLLNDTIDFDKLRESMTGKGKDRLFLGATNVNRGDLKIFHGGELTVDAVLASATLPDVFNAVEIKGEAYWDGGYMGNPPLEPLRFDSPADDTVIVQINPFRNSGTPKSKSEIANMANKLMFNSALVTELRDLERLNHLFETGRLKPSEDARAQRVHRIIDAEGMRDFDHTSKGNTSPAFLKDLKQLGREAAEEWVREALPKVGKESTWKFDWSNPLELVGKPDSDTGPDRRARLQRLADQALGAETPSVTRPQAAGPAKGHDEPPAPGVAMGGRR